MHDEAGRSGTATAAASDGARWRALLLPLARAQDTLARLEAEADAASAAVREGLVARLALHEAAGWLAHHGAPWADATRLALRAAGLTGAWGIAAPSGGADGALADDRLTGPALRLAEAWRALTELETAGQGDPERATLRRVLAALGPEGAVSDDVWRGWRALMDKGAPDLPLLLRAAALAARWQEERDVEQGALSAPALLLAAALWRGRGRGALPLPLWSAPAATLQALALQRGREGWHAGLLAAADAAARSARDRLRHLRAAERRGLACAAQATARSRLPAALDAALRRPALNARGLAAHAGVSTRAGVTLAQQLVEAGVLREATGRGAWRAYVLAEG